MRLQWHLEVGRLTGTVARMYTGTRKFAGHEMETAFVNGNTDINKAGLFGLASLTL